MGHGEAGHGPEDRSGQRWRKNWLRLVIGALLGGGLGFLAGFLVFDDEEKERPAAASGTTLQRITDNPKDFYGDTTLVSGQVREILSPRAFTVSSPGFLGPELLVVSKAPLAAPTLRSATRPILEGDPVQVNGEVRRFDLSEFEKDVGSDLKREFDTFLGDDLGERRGDPAVLADVVTFSSRTTPVVEARSAEEIAARPSDFYGTIVALEGRISDVLPSGALLIDDEVIALTADFAQRVPRKGQSVRIVGPVRPFDPDQRRVAGEPLLPDDEILGKLANRPAVVAQSIQMQR